MDLPKLQFILRKLGGVDESGEIDFVIFLGVGDFGENLAFQNPDLALEELLALRSLEMHEILQPVTGIPKELRDVARLPPGNAVIISIRGGAVDQGEHGDGFSLLTGETGHFISDKASETIAAEI